MDLGDTTMRALLIVLHLVLMSAPATAWQDRDTKVRNDRKAFEGKDAWIYNDLDSGTRAAKAANKPLMVVFRCIPCEACQEFDDDVARRDEVIRDLLDEYICVRIVQANTIDLTRFQYDFDQSFAVILMNADGTIYGRFGTRSHRPEYEDISLEGLRAALKAGLAIHRDLDRARLSLAGKQVKPGPFRTPLEFPSLAGRYGAKLDYEGQVARSCVHCHQVREAERRVDRDAGRPLTDAALYPYPDPEVLGLKLDPKEIATVEKVVANSIADRAGVRVGDQIAALDGQPLLSIADLQWVLHNKPATATLEAEIVREGTKQRVTFNLPQGWRRGDVSWRPTSWDLRRMALGGMRLDDLSAEERAEKKLGEDVMALKVRHVGQFGEHRGAMDAGILKDDVIVSFDGLSGHLTESDLFAHATRKRRPGDEVTITVLRDGERKTMRFALK
jgi:hypothetical protein